MNRKYFTTAIMLISVLSITSCTNEISLNRFKKIIDETYLQTDYSVYNSLTIKTLLKTNLETMEATMTMVFDDYAKYIYTVNSDRIGGFMSNYFITDYTDFVVINKYYEKGDGFLVTSTAKKDFFSIQNGHEHTIKANGYVEMHINKDCLITYKKTTYDSIETYDKEEKVENCIYEATLECSKQIIE